MVSISPTAVPLGQTMADAKTEISLRGAKGRSLGAKKHGSCADMNCSEFVMIYCLLFFLLMDSFYLNEYPTMLLIRSEGVIQSKLYRDFE